MADRKRPSAVEQALLALEKMRRKVEELQRASSEPIAVVGAACRLPGGITTPEELWVSLMRGDNVAREVPGERWDHAVYARLDPSSPGSPGRRFGSFLERLDRFDAASFRISRREAERMDPQQRLMLEVSAEALEDAGLSSQGLVGSRTGVFVGVQNADFRDLTLEDPSSLDAHMVTGGANCMVAGRVSHVFDFRGPSLSVDTACSSSLVAVHLACQSLRARECDLALAGGVNVMLAPTSSLITSKLLSLAPDGRSNAFDANANGFVRGEGCGVVALKRLSDALRDGDAIRGVIRGSAVNHDGRSAGLGAPNARAQELVMRAALHAAEVKPEQVGYIEAHGSATPLGDPIEIEALKAVYGAERTEGSRCVVGSIKPNIGYLEAAGGIAGLIKALLCLEHGQMPPHPSLRVLNPRIALERSALVIPRESVAWPSESPRRYAVVNGFSVPGTNAHVVLEVSPVVGAGDPAGPSEELRAHLLAFSARSPGALVALAQRYLASLAQEPSVAAMAASAATRRNVYAYRMAVVGRSSGELIRLLEERIAKFSQDGTPGERGPRKLVFVCTREGRAPAEVARRLALREPVFAEAHARAARALAACESAPQLKSEIAEQYETFCLQAALAALLDSWGVRPEAVVGQGLGEVAAAHIAGVLGLEEAAQVLTTLVVPGFPPDKIVTALAGLRVERESVPLYSASSGRVIEGSSMGAAYWGELPVRRSRTGEVVEQLVREGLDIFLELTNNQKVGAELEGALRRARSPGRALAALRQAGDPQASLLDSVAALFEQGCCVDLGRLERDASPSVRLPLVPWEHEPIRIAPLHARREAGHHPLWGAVTELVAPRGSYLYRTRLSARSPSYLGECRWRGSPVLPAAAYLELALVAAAARFGNRPSIVEGLELPAPLMLAEDRSTAVQASVTWDGLDLRRLDAARGEFVVGSGEDASLVIHARARIRLLQERGEAHSPSMVAIAPHPEEELDPVERRATQHQRDMADRGLAYGAAFRGVEHTLRTGGRVRGRVVWTNCARQDRAYYFFHPVVLDACLQVLQAALPEGTWLPTAIERVRFYARPEPHRPIIVHAELERRDESGDQTGHLTLFGEDGRALAVLEDIRFSPQDAQEQTAEHTREHAYTLSWEPSALSHNDIGGAERWLILTDEGGVGARLAHKLEARGASVLLAERASEFATTSCRAQIDASRPEHYARLVATAFEGSPASAGVVHLFGLDGPIATAPSVLSVRAASELGVQSVRALVDAIAAAGLRTSPRIWLVTHGVQRLSPASSPVAMAQAPIWGVGRALAERYPELRTTLVDISDGPSESTAETLALELTTESPDQQVAYDGSTRFVARLSRASLDGTGTRSPAAGRPFALAVDTPGILEALGLTVVSRDALGPREVEIEVHATGLNFLDVLTALGARPDRPASTARLGQECAGIISRVGAEVSEFQVGDPVLALAEGAAASFVRTRAELVVHKPPHLDFFEAATLPVVYSTAWYGLVDLAHLEAHERVLIHAATGGVGLAAIEIARARGAEIYATAGSEEKRALLRARGIQHVMDSRSLTFAEDLQRWTAGRGVDVVLNCLTGPALECSLASLAPYGRFVEIAKKELYENRKIGLFPFRQNLSYFAVDLARMVVERPERVGRILREVATRVGRGELFTLPVEPYAISEFGAAFHRLASAKHIGKVALRVDGCDPVVRARIGCELRTDGTVLVASAHGPLSLEIARWLAEQGVRHLAFTSEAGRAAAAGSELPAMGASIEPEVFNGRDLALLEARMDRLAGDRCPLSGVVIAARALDGTIDGDAAGESELALNLHLATQHRALKFFLLFSSGLSLIGASDDDGGAISHAFFVALSDYRRALGLPAACLAFGPLSGFVQRREEQLACMGLATVSARSAFTEMGWLALEVGPSERLVLPLNLRRWIEANPRCTSAPVWQKLQQEAEQAGAHTWRESLAALASEERARALLGHVKEQLGRVLRVSPERIDASGSFGALGLDSLTGLEFRNRLEDSLGLQLPATLVWTFTTPDALSARLLEQLGLADEGRRESGSSKVDATPDTAHLEHLSEEELARQLAEELVALRGD